MFEFTDSEREYHTQMRGITTDAQAREVLRGLTLEETALYTEHQRAFIAGNRRRDTEDKAEFLRLAEKHETARLQALGAEMQMRNENPPIH